MNKQLRECLLQYDDSYGQYVHLHDEKFESKDIQLINCAEKRGWIIYEDLRLRSYGEITERSSAYEVCRLADMLEWYSDKQAMQEERNLSILAMIGIFILNPQPWDYL